MNNNVIKIAERRIGYKHPPLVIAEIGINHQGSLDIAKKMVDMAINSGVEVIKHQTHIVSDEMSPKAKENIVGYIGKSIYQLMDECSLSENQELELKKYVENKGAIFISTPFSRAAADRLAKFDVPAFKIGSGECNNYPLIEHICQFKKPIILSTGMNRIEDIKISVEILRSNKIKFALLHTTNIYPTPHHLVRLDAMKELEKEFDDAVIGLSDHTIDNLSCLGAVALGASILERHFTDDPNRDGPDIKNSMDAKQAKELIDGSKILFQARGGKKGPVNEERDVINFAFSSIVTIKEIKKGEKLDKSNIWVKRPGTGPLYAKDFKKILNKTAKKDIEKDCHLKPEDFE